MTHSSISYDLMKWPLEYIMPALERLSPLTFGSKASLTQLAGTSPFGYQSWDTWLALGMPLLLTECRLGQKPPFSQYSIGPACRYESEVCWQIWNFKSCLSLDQHLQLTWRTRDSRISEGRCWSSSLTGLTASQDQGWLRCFDLLKLWC